MHSCRTILVAAAVYSKFLFVYMYAAIHIYIIYILYIYISQQGSLRRISSLHGCVGRGVRLGSENSSGAGGAGAGAGGGGAWAQAWAQVGGPTWVGPTWGPPMKKMGPNS